MNEIDLLNELVEALKVDVINSLQANGRNASGDTIKALEVVETNGRVELLAPGYIDILERGRGPTSPGAPPADPTLLQRIKAWCNDKGIDEKFAFAITKKIHVQGYKGKPGVLTEPLSDSNVDRHATAIADKLATLLITETIKI